MGRKESNKKNKAVDFLVCVYVFYVFIQYYAKFHPKIFIWGLAFCQIFRLDPPESTTRLSKSYARNSRSVKEVIGIFSWVHFLSLYLYKLPVEGQEDVIL